MRRRGPVRGAFVKIIDEDRAQNDSRRHREKLAQAVRHVRYHFRKRTEDHCR